MNTAVITPATTMSQRCRRSGRPGSRVPRVGRAGGRPAPRDALDTGARPDALRVVDVRPDVARAVAARPDVARAEAVPVEAVRAGTGPPERAPAARPADAGRPPEEAREAAVAGRGR
ncbi:MAG: hypothetical protein ACTMLC_17960, partial [Cellulosimicrobium funkei]